MHRAAYITALVFAGVALAAPAVPAQAAVIPDPARIAEALYPASPCNGKVTIDLVTLANGRLAEAPVNDTTLYPLSCVIRWDVKVHSKMTPHERCATYVHEAGHLAGLQWAGYDHDHAPSGIMSAYGASIYFAPCATLRERIYHALEAKPNVEYVGCAKARGSIMMCRTEQGKSGGIARYRVRINGESFAIKRVRALR